jgi:GTP-binding protein EngB required for normal cell division
MEMLQVQMKKRTIKELPPIQIVLTKCDLVSQSDLARRILQVRQQLSNALLRQPSSLPEMLVSAQIEGQKGVLELQKELAALCKSG